MKKYVLDIKRGNTTPTYRNGDFTLVFDTLQSLLSWLRNIVTLFCRCRITLVSFNADDSPIEGVETDYTRTDDIVFDHTYRLSLLDSLDDAMLTFNCKSKGEVKNRLKKFYPIVDGLDELSTGNILIEKYTWILSTSGQIYKVIDNIDVADL